MRKGEMKMYDYSKLRGRIVEKYGTIKAFAEALGVSNVTISEKLNNKVGITRKDIETWSNILDISECDYGVFYFARNV